MAALGETGSLSPADEESALARARSLEQACDFEGAAKAALEGGDAGWGARLAALARSEPLFELAEAALVGRGTDALSVVGADLVARGFGAFAGRLFDLAGAHDAAGDAFARGGEPARAALAFEKAGKPAEGARMLERALEDDPLADGLRRSLAELLLRHGRVEPAVRVLQQMHDGQERDAALPLLARSLRAMGLSEAAAQVEREIEDKQLATPASGPSPSSAPPPPRSPSQSPGPSRMVLFGRFEVTAEVKQTPHAHLYRARDRILGRDVAVKVLAASARGVGRDALLRFEREARALEKLRHPTVVSIVDFVPEGPAMVLEWMSGGSLADLMQREIFAPARAVEIASAVLSALGEAHRLGILHRDVKPSNVLFDAIGAPKLGDFGAAHLGDLSTTVTAGAIGTFSFMAPEQRLGRPASVQSDIYATGAMLYEMITSEPAEPVPDGEELGGRAPSLFHEDLDARHDRAIASLLAASPSRRPVDAFTARRLLESLPWSSRVLARSGPASRRSSHPPAEPSARLAPPSPNADPRDTGRVFFDTLAERDVIIVPFDEAIRERLAPWAKATHPALAGVLRASVSEDQIWIEAPRGRCLADVGGSLPPSALGELREALAALHQLGGAHGSVDREHVYLTTDGVFLSCPRDLTRAATATDDLRDLERLSRSR